MKKEIKIKKHLISSALILLLITSGFVREYCFTRINIHIEPDNIPEHSAQTIKGQEIIGWMSQNNLYATKWILTGFFTMLFFAVSAILVRHLFNDKKPFYYIGFFYGGVLFTAVICLVIGLLTGHYKESYSIVRPLMGILQSPIPVIVFTPVFWFFEKHSS